MKSVLVTGASSGIGRDVSLRLVQAGFRVFAGVRSKEAGQNLVAQACADGIIDKDRLVPILLDVVKSLSIQKAFSKIEKLTEEQGLWALVNNAGIAVGGPLETIPVEKLREQFQVNVFGLFEVTQKALPMLRQARGRIVNLSSISGRIASPALGAYSASKFAVEALSDSWRRELTGQGVTVSIIEPGPIQTPIWSKSKAEGETLFAGLSQEHRELYGEMIEKLKSAVETAQDQALPPSKVTDAILHALTAEQPRTRYPIGAPITAASWLAGVAPDALMDRLIQFQMRPMQIRLSDLNLKQVLSLF